LRNEKKARVRKYGNRPTYILGMDWITNNNSFGRFIYQEKKEGEEMSNTNDIFQVDYLPDEKKIKINLPEKVWRNIDTIIMTRLLQEELIVEKQKESGGKEE
jgi:hypothetical protein